MRISSHSRSRQAGSIFLVVMVTTGILSVILLGSYLSLASQENRTVMRSLAWNTAMPLAEAGAEEALSHITKNTNNFAADGWALQGTNVYVKSRTLGTGYYSVSISGSLGSLVTITSTGHALFQGTNYPSRTVQVTAQCGSSLPRLIGLVAIEGIRFGGDFAVDSYDSTNALFSTNGRYDPAKATDQAVVATPAGFTMGGHSRIYGRVATAAGFTIQTGGAASVGDAAWVNGRNKGVQSGHSTNDFSADFPEVQAPFNSGTAPGAGIVANTSYNYVLNGGDFMASSLDAGGSSTTMVVTAPSVLYVTGPITVANIVFAPGATLDLYVGSPSLSFCPALQPLTGSDAVTPVQFRVWGLPTCTTLDMTGNALNTSFTGTIYAPQTDLRSAGGSALFGALTARSFLSTGGYDIHYDVATRGFNPPSTGFKVLSWVEL